MAKVILLDAVGTLIHTAEPVGEVYARHFQAAGVTASAGPVDDAFRRRFAAAVRPDYGAHDSGHDAERDWWRRLVAGVLADCGPAGGALAASPEFDRCFDGLFAHYAAASSWR
ncbi:MAG: hypothetical protein HKO57_08805, partial [Akkermansiaceae bacterium]|nr:hypothetical protein [Akkermansiaceae bacterium]